MNTKDELTIGDKRVLCYFEPMVSGANCSVSMVLRSDRDVKAHNEKDTPVVGGYVKATFLGFANP